MKKPKKTNEVVKWKIESGIEIPKLRTSYPFEKFKVGDSVLIIADTKSESQSIKSAAYAYSKHNKCKFTMRAYTREGDFAFRIWRVA